MNKKIYDMMDWARIEGVVYSEENHPETILGPQSVPGGFLVQAFYPDAQAVRLVTDRGRIYEMEQSDEAGMYAVLVNAGKMPHYHYEIDYAQGTVEEKDPYLYRGLMSAQDLLRFERGIHYEAYDFLGAHPMVVHGWGDDTEAVWDAGPEQAGKRDVYGTHFAVWAPNALRVSVVGEFNHWDGRRHQMMQENEQGVFSLFIPDLGPGTAYKYEIKTAPSATTYKSDPYGFASQMRPANASIVSDLSDYAWHDEEWMSSRETQDFQSVPINIYEVHLGSWMQGKDGGFLNYRVLAEKLAAYVKNMGYTHVELMPVMEHPLDESWGYQVTGYYAVTSRYGTPQDFQYFMDYMHTQGIGVILDWVPAHFPKDENGLGRFDGTALYEHLDPRQGEHPHWGTYIYNYGRPQVRNFLIANALFWARRYHADGIRLDAVASMLYLDYGREEGQWIPNIYGGHENLEAIDMLRQLSTQFKQKTRGALLIAEESTAWPQVTGSAQDGGLGFDLKWNMGWMNDFTTYIQTDPLFRKGRHGMLTFSMVYAYSENFILVFSHDEVVHLKGSMYAKMPGSPEEKMANLRVAYGFMMAHPGKKLLFMGQEFGQTTEWNEKQSLPWDEAKQAPHRKLQTYVRALNQFYREHPAFYETDYDPEGFEWLSSLDADHSIVSFMRYSRDYSEKLLVICNFTPVVYENFKVGVPRAGRYKEIFCSDLERYGGEGFGSDRVQKAKEIAWDGRDYSISVEIAPLSIMVFELRE